MSTDISRKQQKQKRTKFKRLHDLSVDSLFGDRLGEADLKRILLKILVISLALTCFIVGFWTLLSGSKDQYYMQDHRRRVYEYYASLHPTRKTHRPFRFQAPKAKAVILVLCRNNDLKDMLKTLGNFEHRFNKKYGYPYVFLNDQPFDVEFMEKIKQAVQKSKAKVKFGQIPREHWSYPKWINQTKAAHVRLDYENRNVIYGGSESYHFMCRFYSGFFQDHPLLTDFEYYWRLEPGVEYLCNIPFDPFMYMADEKKIYGFVLLMKEIPETVPTLWETVINGFLQDHGNLVDPTKSFLRYFSTSKGTYNHCHFWSNFEIATFSFFRSPQYRALFNYLDRSGGFFYERWGDAPIHSLAAGLFLSKEEVCYFGEMGYKHHPFAHCPTDIMWRTEQECNCDPLATNDMTHTQCQIEWENL